jgi:hypothetical protein
MKLFDSVTKLTRLVILALVGLVFIQIETLGQGDLDKLNIDVLEGNAKVILPNMSNKKIRKKILEKQYTSIIDSKTLICANGFDFGNNTSYRIFYTSLDNAERNDSGLGTWKLIESITNKITGKEWIESGWSRARGTYFYYVVLVYPVDDRMQFEKLTFFNVQGKLAFASFQCDMMQKNKWNSYLEFDKTPTIIVTNTHRPRFSSTSNF